MNVGGIGASDFASLKSSGGWRLETGCSPLGVLQRGLGVCVAISAVALQCLWFLKATTAALSSPPLGIVLGASVLVFVVTEALYLGATHLGLPEKLQSALKIVALVSAIPLALPALVAFPMVRYLCTRDIQVEAWEYF
jgi:hypothetical protein